MDKIQLIALDLDDTTLSPDGTLAPETRSAITAAIEQGIEIVVASGRSYATMPDEVLSIPGLRYAIASNGASMYDIRENKRIAGYTLPTDSVSNIIRLADEIGQFALEVIIDGIAFACADYVSDPAKFSGDCSPYIIEYVRNTRTPVDDIRSFAAENSHQLDCINMICLNSDVRINLHNTIGSCVDGLFITSSIAHLLEIASELAGKGNGLRYISNLCGIPLANTACCGNGDNDIDMLHTARIGAAVANATENCKKAADVIIDSCHNNGVAKFIASLI